MQVGDLVKNIHGLYSAEMGIIIEIGQVGDCKYRVYWFDDHKPAWMRADWLEKL